MSMSLVMPVLFLSHGAGGMPFVKSRSADIADIAGYSPLAQFYGNLSSFFPNQQKPSAILVVSGHYQTARPSVTSAAKNKLYYDYGGFPKECYNIPWNPPGAPQVARRVQELLRAANIQCDADENRGLDHGVFVPLAIGFPEATIPVLELSILNSLDEDQHVAIGKAIAPLRNEGVLIIGSGQATHNMRRIQENMGTTNNAKVSWAQQFHNWLVDASTKFTSDERNQKLSQWKTAPGGRDSFPTPGDTTHYIPILTCSGAAGASQGRVIHESWAFGNMDMTCFIFE